MLRRIGAWAFILGVVVAVIVPIFAELGSMLTSFLIVFGLVIGLTNISVKETQPFLLAALALVIVSWTGVTTVAQVEQIGPVLGRIFSGILLLVVPATIIVALRSIYALARD